MATSAATQIAIPAAEADRAICAASASRPLRQSTGEHRRRFQPGCGRTTDSSDVAVLLRSQRNGVALCRQLREWSTMPLIVVSAVDDEDHKVRALDSGADDYITKPFGPRELVARVRAVLRRAERGDEQPRLQLNGLEVDLARRAVRRDGEELKLTPIKYKLLRALVRHRGRLFTHRELLHEVWGAAYLDDRATLRTHVANLRRKLGPAGGPGPIRTYSGAGYRLAA